MSANGLLILKQNLQGKAEVIYSWCCISIIYSLLFWPLLNTLAIIALFAYWLFFAPKTFPQKGLKRVAFWCFIALFLFPVLGMLYTQNLAPGLDELRLKLPLLLFPLIFGTTAIVDRAMLKKLSGHFLIATFAACFISTITLITRLFIIHNLVFEDNTDVFIFKAGYPYLIGMFCIMSIVTAFSF